MLELKTFLLLFLYRLSIKKPNKVANIFFYFFQNLSNKKTCLIANNTQIVYKLQILLTNTRHIKLNLLSYSQLDDIIVLLLFYQVCICGIFDFFKQY